MKAVTFLVAASAAFALPASAKTVKLAAECNITMPCEMGENTPLVERKRPKPVALASDFNPVVRPAGFVGGRLNCARSVNAHLEASGRKGTGSATARSFANWGSPSGPVPGAVARYRCCGPTGHVAVVSHIDAAGKVWIWNPSPRGWKLTQQWRKPIEYRS